MAGAVLLNFDSQLFTSIIGGLYLFAVIVDVRVRERPEAILSL